MEKNIKYRRMRKRINKEEGQIVNANKKNIKTKKLMKSKRETKVMYGVKSNKKGDNCGLFSRKAEDEIKKVNN